MIILRQRDYSRVSEDIKKAGRKTKRVVKQVLKGGAAWVRKHPALAVGTAAAGGVAGGLLAKAHYDGLI